MKGCGVDVDRQMMNEAEGVPGFLARKAQDGRKNGLCGAYLTR